MTNTASLPATSAEPEFKIGQDVHLKTGGPAMIVNKCTQDTDGKFIVDTIWFGVGRAEERGTYQEGLLEAQKVPPHKRKVQFPSIKVLPEQVALALRARAALRPKTHTSDHLALTGSRARKWRQWGESRFFTLRYVLPSPGRSSRPIHTL
jgi:uncharacterized protein YodC (DUF2158 family)